MNNRLDFLPLVLLILMFAGITVEVHTDNFTRWPGSVQEVTQ